MREHPGAFAFDVSHLKQVAEACAKWSKNHDAPPGWGDGQDPRLARLLWLKFWMGWALENCERPTIQNY